jgi:hypothetical protein
MMAHRNFHTRKQARLAKGANRAAQEERIRKVTAPVAESLRSQAETKPPAMPAKGQDGEGTF